MPHPNFISSCDLSEFKGQGLLQKVNLAVRAPCCPHSVAFLTLLPATRGVLCLQHLDSISPSLLISCVSGFPEAHPLLLAVCTRAPQALLSLPASCSHEGPIQALKREGCTPVLALELSAGLGLPRAEQPARWVTPAPAACPDPCGFSAHCFLCLRGWGFLLHPEARAFRSLCVSYGVSHGSGFLLGAGGLRSRPSAPAPEKLRGPGFCPWER